MSTLLLSNAPAAGGMPHQWRGAPRRKLRELTISLMRSFFQYLLWGFIAAGAQAEVHTMNLRQA
ncbi:MAG TPA: hypothetical protein VLW65_05670, partial [Bryobacteraceae bacterium]|nr:hypothetical protein [Bryobacteraceae bacterium]